ncbi:MAG: hypothetical protein Q9168_006789 [Polycauliona sp. 1 TL-2023]
MLMRGGPWGIIWLLSALDVSNALTIPTEGALVNTPSPPATNISSLNELQIDCDGPRYGSNVRYSSCLEAFRTFQNGHSENAVLIRRRNTGGPGQPVRNLPWMWVSGQKGTLGIIIRPYDPANVQCGPRGQVYDDTKCDALLNEVPAETIPERTWGPRNKPGVDIGIPYAWRLGPPHDSCRLVVAGNNAGIYDHMTRYDAWHASVVLAAMCARVGRTGIHTKLGAQERLVVIIDDGSRPLTSLAGKAADGGEAVETQTLVANDGEWDVGWNRSVAVA